MTMSIRFFLSNDNLDHLSKRKHIVDMDVVNDITCIHQSVITCVIIQFLACLYKCTGRAIALSPASALAAAVSA